MLLRNWLLFLNETQRQTRNRRAKGRRPHVPAEIEALEDRTLLTAFVVNTLNDTVAFDGVVSLREALISANNNFSINPDVAAGQADFDSITFAASIAGGTIQLDPFSGA